jgi:hypothetical protein
LQGNGQNDQPRQRQETVPDRERIIEIVGVQAIRSGVSKTFFRILFWVVGVIVLVDSMRMIMVVRVGVCMTMEVGMVRMRSRRLVG